MTGRIRPGLAKQVQTSTNQAPFYVPPRPLDPSKCRLPCLVVVTQRSDSPEAARPYCPLRHRGLELSCRGVTIALYITQPVGRDQRSHAHIVSRILANRRFSKYIPGCFRLGIITGREGVKIRAKGAEVHASVTRGEPRKIINSPPRPVDFHGHNLKSARQMSDDPGAHYPLLQASKYSMGLLKKVDARINHSAARFSYWADKAYKSEPLRSGKNITSAERMRPAPDSRFRQCLLSHPGNGSSKSPLQNTPPPTWASYYME